MQMTVHDELLRLTNAERNNPLGVHASLQQAAQKHAEWMATNRRMSHRGAGGSDFSDRIREAGYPTSTAGENVAMGYSTPAACIRAWMTSSGHRRNMLNTAYRSAGFGAAKGSNGSWYWCGLYGAAMPDHAPPPPIPDPIPPPAPRRTFWEWLLSLFGSRATEMYDPPAPPEIGIAVDTYRFL